MDNVPCGSPIILIANHNNQFLDGGIINTTFSSIYKNKFIVASKALTFPIVNQCLAVFGCIKVERPQDKVGWRADAKVATYFVEEYLGQPRLCLKLTNKVDDINKGAAVMVQSIPNSLIVLETKDREGTTVLICTESIDLEKIKDKESKNLFKVIPKMDSSSIYQDCIANMQDDCMICIFPEGGSNDQFELLPFKPGYSIMYYEGLKAGKKPYILPIGINYRNQQLVRSSVIVNIGKPLSVDPSTLQDYLKGGADKRKVVNNLLVEGKKAVEDLLIQSNYIDAFNLSIIATDALKYDIMVENDKAINKNKKKLINKIEIRKKITEYLSSDKESAKKIIPNLIELRTVLQEKGLKIYDMHYLKKSLNMFAFIKFFYYVFFIIILNILELPFHIFVIPTTYIIHWIAERERIYRLNESNVKLQAQDVVASYKILMFFYVWPLFYAYTSVYVMAFNYYFMPYYFGWKFNDITCLIIWFPLKIILFVQNLYLLDYLWQCYKKAYAMALVLFDFNKMLDIYQQVNEIIQDLKANIEYKIKEE